jgi:putative heme-binding domain-containing protein
MAAVAPLLVAQEHLPATMPATTQVVELPTSPGDLAQGARLFATHCAACHGPAGEGGKGPTLATATLPRASDDAALLKIVREGISGTEMPRTRFDIGDAPRVAAFVKSLGSRPREIVPGDAKRGAEVYAKGQCAKCHAIRGEGGAFGPDLNDIGRRRSAAHLRRSIVDPAAEVPQAFNARNEAGLPQNFLAVRVVTRGGERFEGARVNEDTFSIQIRDATGKVRSYLKPDLAELHKDCGASPMPSYASAFTSDELDDLVAYMMSLRESR